MTARPKALSARARACELWDDGDARSDAELAAALGVATQTIIAYHQKWNRANGKRNGRKLPPEVQVAILEMRNIGKMPFPDIAEVITEDFGCEAGTKLVYACYRHGCCADSMKLVEVNEADLPLETTAGLCWSMALEPPHTANSKRGLNSDFCDLCPHREQCCAAELKHWFVGCERPLELEVVEV